MHYNKFAFAIDNTIATITPLIGNPTLGQRVGFSSVRMILNMKLIK
jgi:hypothetical protein